MEKNRFYNDEKFLGSMSGRPLRILSEYLGPLSKLQKNNIQDTIVFFGSARINSKSDYYKKAEDLGYFKIDLLNVNIYEYVKNEAHLNTLLKRDPDWHLLLHKEIVQQLFHIHDHYDIVVQMQPRSIDQLAMVLAIIRPAKRSLLGESWQSIQKQVWLKPKDNSYYFKKSHAVSYAYAIIVQLNSLCELAESADA